MARRVGRREAFPLICPHNPERLKTLLEGARRRARRPITDDMDGSTIHNSTDTHAALDPRLTWRDIEILRQRRCTTP
jgi:hypothetical protein